MINKQNCRAFSLIEVMIAIVILSIVSVTIFSMFSQARTGTMQTRDEIIAFSHASTILNYARGLPFDDAFLTPVKGKKITELLTPDTSLTQTLFEIAPIFDCALTITDHEPDASLSLYAYKVLKVDVEWRSGGVKRKISSTALHVGVPK
ncbi:MAG: prepilin-type N-terminal cleavage/methylation domain-containing protein [Candidatus Riflebacteria bacterium]|nr:prepilin-type N-terminal cleavage/methylation domain-containing protein [Candidatus Riflebacteria bacterium]